jgi:protein-tyrosine phosphatase
MIVELPNGVIVQATGIGRPGGDPDPDFGLYLDQRWADAQVPWDHTVIDWPDFGVPLGAVSTRRAHEAIRDAYERAVRGERVEVACIGGIGRTGTVLGCMAVLAGVPAADARRWVREHYRSIAIETEQQHQFIVEFAG